ncbi:phage tail sheath family protein [Lentzea sp. NPDC054927]
MPTYMRPGVYIEEVDAGSWTNPQLRRPYEPPRPLKPNDTKWLAEHSIAAFIGRPARHDHTDPTYVTSWDAYRRQFWDISDETMHLPRAVQGFFQNGGTGCWIVPQDEDLYEVFTKLERIDDISTVCVPDVTGDDELAHSLRLGALAHCELMGDRIAIIDPPQGLSAQQVRDWRTTRGYDSKYVALYYPWLRVIDHTGIVSAPPCGHVAGAYARSDLLRGPQRQAANLELQGVLGLEQDLTKAEQELLHPWGINCLVSMASGIRVWGSRTMSSDPAWRYLNRRRLMNFIGRNIVAGTSWAIFEDSYDKGLFQRIESALDEFLGLLWRAGVLEGETPAEAYSVRCDDAANPDESRDANQIIAECGITVARGQSFFRVVYFLG